MHTLHVVTNAITILAAAHAKGRPVRFWLNASGEVTGTWLAKNGSTLAVGRCYARDYRPCIYRACPPSDNFAHGGLPASAGDINDFVLQQRAQGY